MKVTQEMVNRFCEITGDFNAIHTDEEYAKTTKFGGCIAPGTLVNGIIGAEIARQYPGCVLVEQYLKFKAPCYIGDDIEVVLIEEDSDGRRKLLKLQTECITGHAIIYERK